VLVCALMFAITATVVNRWGREHWIPVNRQTTYTATAHAVEKPTGVTTPFTISDVDPRRAKTLANTLAERYAADHLAEWRHSKEDNCQKAHESAEKARQECRENVARLETFERQRREAAPSGDTLGGTAGLSSSAGNTVGQANRATPPIDNPRWGSLQQQISDLERRRSQLLADRTPLHPAVQEIEGRLASVREQLAATPRQIPGNDMKTAHAADTKATVPLPIDDLAAKHNQRKLDELAATLEKSRLACQKAERAERQALQVQKVMPQFVFQYAEAVQDPPHVDYGWRRLIWTTFAASLLMVFGVASVALGTSIEPPVASIEEVEADLGQSVIGVIPDHGSAPDVAMIHRQSQMRRAVIAIGVLLILACPVVAIWGVTGI